MIPVISMWMSWTNWVMLGWKTIETRTHRRFASLAGKRIGIHAAIKWDRDAIELSRPFMNLWQTDATEQFPRIGGSIIGTALVTEHRLLTAKDSSNTFIDCENVRRYGLILERLRTCEAIPCRGKQGIWYENIG